MMPQASTDNGHERIYADAHDWVAKMLDDPKAHAAGLRAWVGGDQERADAYNDVYREAGKGGRRGAQLYGRVHERQANRVVEKVRTIPVGKIIGLSFALMIAGAALSVGISALGERLAPGHNAVSASTFATRVGEIRTVTLPDGSRVTMDTRSEIRVAYSSSERRVDLLAGRVRFDVLHNDRVPFKVYALGMTVTDRGTVFDVDTEGALRVHLLKGAADVAPPPGTSSAAPRVIHLGLDQTIEFSRTSGSVPDSQPIPARWIEGRPTFDDVPAFVVAREANRYSATQIEFAMPETGNEQVFLDVDVRNPRLVADHIAKVLKLDVDTSQAGRIILRRKP